jgi:hypothetical protein
MGMNIEELKDWFFDKLYSEKKDEKQNELKELTVDRIRKLISNTKKV